MAGHDDEFPAPEQVLAPQVRDMEAPTEDAVEQSIPANPGDIPVVPRTAFEADEYDAIEQSRVVELDEDYY